MRNVRRPITVIIPANNESHNIEAVLESVQWAEEILVIDSYSTDNTAELARQYTDKVIQHEYEGPAAQKNWAIPQASHEWILLLDADERITTDLRQEIQSILAQTEIVEDAFWIGRQSYFMGQQVRYSGWQNDAVIRLIHRDKCRYNKKQVHEEIETTGIKVGRLQKKMLHYTFKNTDHFLAKMQRYADYSIQDYWEKTPRVTYFHLFGKPFFRFVKHFFIQKGFLDGKVGFIISVIMAWGVFLRYVKIKERQKNQ